MPPLPRELETSFDQYDAMQADHIRAVKAHHEAPPDLVKHNFERSRAFENLRVQLSSVLNKIERNRDDNAVEMGVACQDRLAAIQAQDKELKNHIEAYRDMLKKQKCHMIQGKKALQGYQNSGF